MDLSGFEPEAFRMPYGQSAGLTYKPMGAISNSRFFMSFCLLIFIFFLRASSILSSLGLSLHLQEPYSLGSS